MSNKKTSPILEPKKGSEIDYTQKVLEVKHLEKFFFIGSGKNKLVVPAVNDVTFDVYKREIFGLVGESGCGKTTTGRTIIKLYKPTNGQVIFNGLEIGAGSSGLIKEIAETKENAKAAIAALHPLTKKQYDLKLDAHSKLELLDNDWRKSLEKHRKTLKELNLPINNYKAEVYNARSLRDLAIGKIQYAAILAKQELIDLTSNNQEVEYKMEVKSAKLLYTRKTEGLKDSSGLTKETIIKRLEKLKSDYELTLAELQLKYEPLIAQNAGKVQKKSDIVDQLKKIKLDQIEKIKEEHHQYDLRIAEISLPNYVEVQAKIKEAKADFQAESHSLHSQKKQIKQNLAQEIALIQKDLHAPAYLAEKQATADAIKQVNDRAVAKLDAIKKDYDAKCAELSNSQDPDQTKKKEQLTAEYHLQSGNIYTEKRLQIEKLSPDLAIINQRNLKISEIKAEIQRRKEINNSKTGLQASHKMQMIFQDPISSLNPRMTVREIVGEGLTIQGDESPEEIKKKVAQSLELVGLMPEYMARYPHEFSGGQRQRIGVARALIMNPDFIIADEPISALDVSIRAQVINLLSELKTSLGLTILFIAHDLSVVRFFCDRIAVMYYGKIVELATSEELFAHPMHPYTVSLLSAVPQPDPDYEKGRTRIHYNFEMHNYRLQGPSLRDIAPNHQVLANDEEFIAMQEKYKQQTEEAK